MIEMVESMAEFILFFAVGVVLFVTCPVWIPVYVLVKLILWARKPGRRCRGICGGNCPSCAGYG